MNDRKKENAMRGMLLKMVNIVFVSSLCCLCCSAVEEVVFSDVKVRSMSPWGVAVDFVVNGLSSDEIVRGFEIKATVGGETRVAESLSGDLSCVNGHHRIYWNMAQDLTESECVENASITVALKMWPLYCVVDFAAGPNALQYPITYLDVLPNPSDLPEEYKTTKLVLKRVDPSKMTNLLTKPYYLGIYEISKKQWELVMGGSSESKYPAEVSYDKIRGSVKGATWPSSSDVDETCFLGRLRNRTGLEFCFDLPTEQQWAIACMAGTTTTWSFGDSQYNNQDRNIADYYMVYTHDSYTGWSQSPKQIGGRSPNPWGFCDMHGNVAEWCIDWYLSSTVGVNTVADYKGPSLGETHVIKGGRARQYADKCTSRSRDSAWPGQEDQIGFRLSRTLR